MLEEKTDRQRPLRNTSGTKKLSSMGTSDGKLLLANSELYTQFIQQLIVLSQHQEFNLAHLLNQYLQMNYPISWAKIDCLKTWLDSFRPLDPVVVAELKKLYDVRFTYNSNAILLVEKLSTNI